MYLITGLLVLLIIVLFIGARWYTNYLNFWTQHKAIPSVPGRIFSGNIKDILTFKTNFGFNMKTIYEDPKFQNEAVVGVCALQPALLVRDPELIKSILIRDFDCFRNRFSASDPHHDPVGGLSLFFARYNIWKDFRTKMSPIFTSAKLKQMYPLIQQVGDNLENFLRKNGVRQVYELKDLACLYTTDIIASTVFGISSNALENPTEEVNVKARQLANFNLRRALNLLVISFAPKFNAIFKPRVFFNETGEFLRSTIECTMKDRENTGFQRNDMIDIFLKLKQEAQVNGHNMKAFMDGLTAQTTIFIVGGFETSSSTISNLLLEVAKQPQLLARLRKEICEAFVKGHGSISYGAINDLEYLNMCIDETLRMYPVFPLIERQYLKPKERFDQYSLKPFYDFNIPEGMAVYISTYGLNYDPQYWPNPSAYDPERFSPENKKSINPMIFLPYGEGPHNCIGARLGQLQMKACIVHILKNHYVQVCSETKLKADFNAKAFVLQTKGGIHLEIVRDDQYHNSATEYGQ